MRVTRYVRWVSFGIVFGAISVAQPSSVRDCSAVLAKDWWSYAENNDLMEDLLRSIDSESWSRLREDQSLSASVPFSGGLLSFGDTYSKFDEKRNRYLESLHYGRTRQQAINILKVTTSDRAYTAYENCLRQISVGPALVVWVSRETMSELVLHVKWLNGAGVKEMDLAGVVEGGSVDGEAPGMLWAKGNWFSHPDRWGVNQEKVFTIRREPGVGTTKVTITPSDGSAPFTQAYERADGVLTLSYVGTQDVPRGTRIASSHTPNNHENHGGCPNQVGIHDGRYCVSRTSVSVTATAPRFLTGATLQCNGNGCPYGVASPVSISQDGLTATACFDNWGSDVDLVLVAQESEHVSAAQCGSEQRAPVIFEESVLFGTSKECMPLAKVKWSRSGSTPRQGALTFGWTMSPGGEVSMEGKLIDSTGPIILASYRLNR